MKSVLTCKSKHSKNSGLVYDRTFLLRVSAKRMIFGSPELLKVSYCDRSWCFRRV